MKTLTKTYDLSAQVGAQAIVVVSIDEEKRVGTQIVNGDVIFTGELNDHTSAQQAFDNFDEDVAIGAYCMWKDRQFFEQTMQCRKSFVALGGILEIALVAPSEASKQVGIIARALNGEGEYVANVAPEYQVLGLNDESIAQDAIRLFTQDVANHMAAHLVMTGTLPTNGHDA